MVRTEMNPVPQSLLVHPRAHPECVCSLTSAIMHPQSCATSLKPTSQAHPLPCLVNFPQEMIILILLPQLPLPAFCSFLFSALMAITCQQLCFEFLTFSMKSKLSLNTAHHFQSALCIFILNSQLHHSELRHLSTPSWLLPSPWKPVGEQSRHHTSKPQVFGFVSTLCTRRALPLALTQRTGTCHQKQYGWVHTTTDGQT